ncbi:MAG: RlmE family RNA methyltransferase [Planctomycetota bacterium]|jgi:23S rRNA (uridine2552-2'-O)-methyltransferase
MKQIQDAFFRRAKREGYFARSVYKLEAMDQKFKLFKPGMAVLDLGSSPGSWIQYLCKVVGEKGGVAGVDISPVKPSIRKMAHVLLKDINECTAEDFAPVATSFDAVVSDMAPKTTGVRITDQARSLELCEIAFGMAEKVLKGGGSFVCKVFQSPELSEFLAVLRPQFREVSTYKPEACRDESFETFVVCLGYGEDPKKRNKKKVPEAGATTGPKKRKKKGKRKGGKY